MALISPGRIRNGIRRLGYEVQRLDPAGPPQTLSLHVTRLFAEFGVNAVIDVGARYGHYRDFLRSNGYMGPVMSFEPVRANLSVLERRVAEDPAWTVRGCALGSEPGRMKISVTAMTAFSSFRSPNDYSREQFGGEVDVVGTEEVEVRRLDDIIDGLFPDVADPRIYLKMDTQGWDLEVLAGAERALDRVVALQSEVSVRPIYDGMPGLTESLQTFEERGFLLSGLFPVNVDRDFAAVEFDCVAVRRR